MTLGANLSDPHERPGEIKARFGTVVGRIQFSIPHRDPEIRSPVAAPIREI